MIGNFDIMRCTASDEQWQSSLVKIARAFLSSGWGGKIVR